MSKILVLAEKPSVGKEIARVLGCKKSGGGYISGDKYIVTWALGHLVTLAEPEYYGDKYKTWSLETLPMLPEKMELKVIPETSKQYSIVKNLLHNNEINSLVIATDAGREGELVARWIIEKAKFNKPIKRLWISSQTDKAIKDGFSKLKDGKEYINLYRSAVSRAQADWIVGLNITRALTCKYNAQLSAGRVQTPTLAIIAQREEEIKKFIPKDYYVINADMGNFFATYCGQNNQSAIFDAEKAKKIAEKIKNSEFTVVDVKKTAKKTPPPMLYDLTELQRDANKLYQLSPKETLNTMQRLYETHKALTYPRTDSRYITDDIVPTLSSRLKAVSKGEFAPLVSEIIREKRQISKACVNNAKVTDHHAIIPTEESVDMSSMNTNEKRIFMLVVKRFLTCFFPAYEFEKLRIELISEGEKFYSSGRTVINKGWKKVFDLKDEDEDDEQVLPKITKGQKFKCINIQLKSLKTTPPARYTEATLLSAMENPSKFIEDKSMKEFINGGLGTPATRADIIEKLFSSFYIEKNGNSIIPTQKGLQLITLVPNDLREPLMTAKWEEKLEQISKGKGDDKKFINEIKQYTKLLVKDVSLSQKNYVHHNITRTVCPECGKFLLAVNGKKGKMLVCQDRNCGYRQNVSMETNIKCPQCHKRMELFGDGDKKMYVCRCGFREKAETFHKRIKETSGASKQTVKEYLKKQSKENKNNDETLLGKALADALKQLNN